MNALTACPQLGWLEAFRAGFPQCGFDLHLHCTAAGRVGPDHCPCLAIQREDLPFVGLALRRRIRVAGYDDQGLTALQHPIRMPINQLLVDDGPGLHLDIAGEGPVAAGSIPESGHATFGEDVEGLLRCIQACTRSDTR